MLLDCTTCPGRGLACDGCMVAAVLDPTTAMPPDVAAAVALLRRSGLIGPAHLAIVAAPELRGRGSSAMAGQLRAG